MCLKGQAHQWSLKLSRMKHQLKLHRQYYLARRPSLLWSPQGNFLWVNAPEHGYILACQQGQQVLEVDTHSMAPSPHWSAFCDVFLMSSNRTFFWCWGSLTGYHAGMREADLHCHQWWSSTRHRHWLSLCGRLLATLAASQKGDRILTLFHQDGSHLHEIDTAWVKSASMAVLDQDRKYVATHACLDWLSMPQHVLIFALAVLRCGCPCPYCYIMLDAARSFASHIFCISRRGYHPVEVVS